jgi:hypothetical protein
VQSRTRSRYNFSAVALAALLSFLAPSSRTEAASVPYVGSVPLTENVGESPALTGIVLAQRSVPFILLDADFDAAYDLTLHNSVVRVEGAGTLDFYYRVTNSSDRPLRLVDMDTGRFTRPGSVDLIDVNLWDEATGTYAPVLADRGRSNFGGVALDFPAADVLAPGESSRLFFIRTAATRYELAGLTQFRSTPGTTTDNGFALTFSPVLEGPLVPPPQPGEPVVVPLPPAAPVAGVMMLLGMAVAQRARRR